MTVGGAVLAGMSMREWVVLGPLQALTASRIVDPTVDGSGGSADSEDADHRWT
jgi:hypothetical protein